MYQPAEEATDSPMSDTQLNLPAIQEHLANRNGRDYWRSLEELAATPAFTDFLQREFPRQASEWRPSMSRRGFLQLMGASLALAGLTACAPAQETIVPYVEAPEALVPGKPLFYATALQQGGYALGLLAQSYDGRPTKLEGNPDHPASLGATDSTAQASILDLYDPDRSQSVRNGNTTATWAKFLASLREQLTTQQANGGAGLRILTESVTSPTVAAQMAAIFAQFPNARWHQYEPVNRDTVYAGTALAFGQAVEPIYRFAQADLIVSLDADFLADGPGHVRHARDFADGRRANPTGTATTRKPNRLYAIESTPTITGAAADHRLPLRPEQIEQFAGALAAALDLAVTATETTAGLPQPWLDALVADLQANRGRSLVIAGAYQPPAVHALAHAINSTLGNVGETVVYSAPLLANQPEQPATQLASLQALVAEMNDGTVDLLLILGGNPIYYAPADLDFAGALAQVAFSAQLGLYADETAAQTTWHIPAAHYLEHWSDARAYDGTVSIQQPLIEPLYAGHAIHELLDALISPEVRSSHDLVRTHWLEEHGEDGFDPFWRRALHDGLITDTAAAPRAVTLASDLGSQLPANSAGSELTLILRPDPSIGDGRFANNGWLQELPKPLTKLTWTNAALINPLTADGLGLTTGDLVELGSGEHTLQLPILLLPGHCEGAITVHLGYGRTQAGRVGNGTGANAYPLRTSDALWHVPGVTVRKVDAGQQLPITQNHHTMDGRDLIRVGTMAEFAADPQFVHDMGVHVPEISLYPKMEYNENSWGMAIDLTACIGCNACVIACQAENNIPIVGKEEVINGREMHWIRIDQYYEGDLTNPATHHQPVTCMHCENAPCEVVCPVAATMHDSEGLNTMIYNRCVGTRYCANNCPYKVRRFNFLEFTDYDSESLQLQRNPNVTVRSRGVMEKCTYCVQRISAARITAKLEGRPIQDGDVMTACQSACPTRAINFGNLNDPTSAVVQQKASPLNYGLLTELNTQPRTTYLARLRNPNPALAEA
jgi:molybdopterin-containing oxidoreductase family iron-sulfur binding subunit